MVSGIGFKNTANEQNDKGRHKKTVSTGLIVAATLLGLVILVWAGLKMENKSVNDKLATLEADTLSTNKQVSTALSEKASDSALRAYVMEKELYREYEVNDILNEIENIMILKDSDGSRVVLKSFQYNAGAYTKKTFKQGSATLVGAGSVTITADADTFDAMAQQIDTFKKSPYFNNVQVGTTDRDDSGRIVFTLTMDTVKNDKSPYEVLGDENNQSEVISETSEESMKSVNVNDESVNGEDVSVTQNDEMDSTSNEEPVADSDNNNTTEVNNK